MAGSGLGVWTGAGWPWCVWTLPSRRLPESRACILSGSLSRLAQWPHGSLDQVWRCRWGRPGSGFLWWWHCRICQGLASGKGVGRAEGASRVLAAQPVCKWGQGALLGVAPLSASRGACSWFRRHPACSSCSPGHVGWFSLCRDSHPDVGPSLSVSPVHPSDGLFSRNALCEWRPCRPLVCSTRHHSPLPRLPCRNVGA